MTNKQREKDDLKHQKTTEDLMKLPPKWTVVKHKSGMFNYFDEEDILHFCNTTDNNTTRMYCWAVYNAIKE